MTDKKHEPHKAHETHKAHQEHAVPAHAPAKHKPKFKVGDKVTVNGSVGKVCEVVAHDSHWLDSGEPQMYSVQLDPWTREEFADVNGNMQVRYVNPADPKEKRGHEADTLGGIPEAAIQAEK